jgi:hypothetical protein
MSKSIAPHPVNITYHNTNPLCREIERVTRYTYVNQLQQDKNQQLSVAEVTAKLFALRVWRMSFNKVVCLDK